MKITKERCNYGHEGPFWYFTTHGVQPGSIPKGVHVLEIRDGRNDKGTMGTFVALDGVLTTDELREYDMKEMKPRINEGIDIDRDTNIHRVPLYMAKDEIAEFDNKAKAYPYWVIETEKWYDPEGLNIPNDKKYNIRFAGTREECRDKLKQIEVDSQKHRDWKGRPENIIEDRGENFITIYYTRAIAKATFMIIKNPDESLKEDFKEMVDWEEVNLKLGNALEDELMQDVEIYFSDPRSIANGDTAIDFEILWTDNASDEDIEVEGFMRGNPRVVKVQLRSVNGVRKEKDIDVRNIEEMAKAIMEYGYNN